VSKEDTLWTWFYGGLHSFGHLMRVENVVQPGTPDVNYVIGRREGWVELKSRADLPARASTPLFTRHNGLRPDQIEWLVERAKFSSTAYIGARALDTFFLVPAHRTLSFNGAPMDLMRELAVFQHRGRMSLLVWARLASVLAGKAVEPHIVFPPIERSS
jgi:hypothetical protein